jgi:hypothetical protein
MDLMEYNFDIIVRQVVKLPEEDRCEKGNCVLHDENGNTALELTFS